MAALRNRITTFDASAWAKRFIDYLSADKPYGKGSSFDLPERIASGVDKRKPLTLFLDYDGTLFPIVRLPQLAAPDRPLLNLIEALADHPRFDIHIVSGRPQDTLENWFGHLNIGLHAEHGALSRDSGDSSWSSNIQTHGGDDWKNIVKDVLEDYCKNTPGSFIEEKNHSLAWHYRMSDQVIGERMAKELRHHAREAFAPLGLEVMKGKRVIEIKPMGISKGFVVKQILSNRTTQGEVIAIGDDVTDEHMFDQLPEEALSICVGSRPTKARFRVRGPVEVRSFLEGLLDSVHAQ